MIIIIMNLMTQARGIVIIHPTPSNPQKNIHVILKQNWI